MYFKRNPAFLGFIIIAIGVLLIATAFLGEQAPRKTVCTACHTNKTPVQTATFTDTAVRVITFLLGAALISVGIIWYWLSSTYVYSF